MPRPALILLALVALLLQACAPDTTAPADNGPEPGADRQFRWMEATGSTMFGAWSHPGGGHYVSSFTGELYHRAIGSDSWTRTQFPSRQLGYCIWGRSPVDLYAAGSGGALASYDGEDWDFLVSGTGESFRALAGNADYTVAVAGGELLSRHPTLGSFGRVLAPEDIQLLDVHALPDEGGFVAVASQGQVYQGSTPHGMELLEPEESLSSLRNVWAADDGEIFAVGSIGNKLLHFDGVTWVVEDIDAPANLYDVWGTSSNNVYISGRSGVLTHFDGDTGTRIFTGTEDPITAISGLGENDIIAVGHYGTLLHYDGASWRQDIGRLPGDVLALWGSSPDDLYAFGSGDEIFHYDGSRWSVDEKLDLSIIDRLNDATGFSPTDVFVVGDNGLVYRRVAGSWFPMQIDTEDDLEAIWGSASDDVYAVGDNGFFHFDGSSWSRIENDVVDSFVDGDDIYGFGADDIWVIDYSRAYHFDGTEWSQISLPSNGQYAIWGSGPDDIYTGGSFGDMTHFDGSEWTSFNIGFDISSQRIERIDGTGPDDVWATTSIGRVFHFDGMTWSEVEIATEGWLFALQCFDDGTVYVAGSPGNVFVYD